MSARPPLQSLAELTWPERLVVIAYSVLELAFPVAGVLILLTLHSDWRLGAIAIGVVLLLRFLVRDLYVGLAVRDGGALDELTASERASLALGFGFYAAAFGGGILALLGSAAGAVLILIGLGGHLLAHLVVSIGAYRRVMARPWPDVEPLTDDDW